MEIVLVVGGGPVVGEKKEATVGSERASDSGFYIEATVVQQVSFT